MVKPRITFSSEITLGSIITLASVLITGSVGWTNLSNRVDKNTERLVKVEASMDNATKSVGDLQRSGDHSAADIGATKNDIARLEHRLDAVDSRADIIPVLAARLQWLVDAQTRQESRNGYNPPKPPP